jgi:hypothetical protein
MRIMPRRPAIFSSLTRVQRCLAAILLLAALLTSAESDGRKIQVLVLGNEGQTHPLESTVAEWVPGLAKEGVNFFYSSLG